jgi:hypothetical protein
MMIVAGGNGQLGDEDDWLTRQGGVVADAVVVDDDVIWIEAR